MGKSRIRAASSLGRYSESWLLALGFITIGTPHADLMPALQSIDTVTYVFPSGLVLSFGTIEENCFDEFSQNCAIVIGGVCPLTR